MKIIDFMDSFRSPTIIKLLDDQHKLYEGLIKSYSPEETIGIIKRTDTDCAIKYHRSNPGQMLILFKRNHHSNIDKVLDKIKVCGWFPSVVTINGKHSKDIDRIISTLDENDDLFIAIEAKYNYDLTEQVLKYNKFLYHIAPTKNLEKILKIGLTPKTRSKLANHPDRIYLALSIDAVKHLKHQFAKITKEIDWTFLKIDVKTFNEVGGGRLFSDSSFEGEGVFTLSNIQPKYIEVMKD